MEEPVTKGPQLICTGYACMSKKSYFKGVIGGGPDSLRANVLLSVHGREMIIRKSLIPEIRHSNWEDANLVVSGEGGATTSMTRRLRKVWEVPSGEACEVWEVGLRCFFPRTWLTWASHKTRCFFSAQLSLVVTASGN